MSEKAIYGLEAKCRKTGGKINWKLLRNQELGEKHLKKWQKQKLYDYDPLYRIERAEEFFITRDFFYPPEAALVRARGMLLALAAVDKTGRVLVSVRQEWLDLLSQTYDSSWFLGGLTEEIWEKEFIKNVQAILDGSEE